MSSVAQRQYVTVALTDGGTAGTADTRAAAVGGTGTWVLEAVSCCFEDAVTSNDTDHAVITINAADGTALASETTETSGSGGTGDLTAFEGFAIPITGTGTDLEAAAPGGYQVVMTKVSSGVAVSNSTVTLTLRKLQV